MQKVTSRVPLSTSAKDLLSAVGFCVVTVLGVVATVLVGGIVSGLGIWLTYDLLFIRLLGVDGLPYLSAWPLYVLGVMSFSTYLSGRVAGRESARKYRLPF